MEGGRAGFAGSSKRSWARRGHLLGTQTDGAPTRRGPGGEAPAAHLKNAPGAPENAEAPGGFCCFVKML